MLTRKKERLARVTRYFFSSFVLIKTELTKTKFLRNRFQIVEVVFEEIEKWQFHNIYLHEKYSKGNLKSVGASTSRQLLGPRSRGEAVKGTPII